jgi:hypothetical protein
METEMFDRCCPLALGHWPMATECQQGLDPTVVSAAAISITAAPAERSCQGRTAHTGSRAPIPAGSARRNRVVSSVRANR